MRMLGTAERTAISEAVNAGVAGVKFDHNLLKAIHVVLPLRDCFSFMDRAGMSKFPICFLHDSPTCSVKKHNKVATTKFLIGGTRKLSIRKRCSVLENHFPTSETYGSLIVLARRRSVVF